MKRQRVLACLDPFGLFEAGPVPLNPWRTGLEEREWTAMKLPGLTEFTAWVLVSLWCLSYPGSACAQLRGGLGQRGRSNSAENVPGLSGPRAFGLPGIPGPFPLLGGIERQSQGQFLQREIGPADGSRRRFNNTYPSDRNAGQLYQAADGNWYYSDGRAFMTPSRSVTNAGQPAANFGSKPAANVGPAVSGH